MAVDSPVKIDGERVEELTRVELERLNARTALSEKTYERARRSLSGGVASSYQVRDPWPIYLVDGEGPRVTDVDGNTYWDFHNGFGSMVQGHGNPAIAEAVADRARLGTHFAAVTEDTIVVAELLAERFGMPLWRIVNSGSEATMDAIRIARGLTGRDTVMKIFGSYHGHHDAVMVSIGVPYDQIGDREEYDSLPYGAGIPKVVSDLTIAVPFNDAGAMERRIEKLKAEDRLPACVIMEAAMMNLGVVLPEPGYLEAVREITRRHGIVLIFDEVKTGSRDRRRRRDRAFRGRARHGDARKDARRRAPGRRDRRKRGGDERRRATAPSTRSGPTTGTRSSWRRPARASKRC